MQRVVVLLFVALLSVLSAPSVTSVSDPFLDDVLDHIEDTAVFEQKKMKMMDDAHVASGDSVEDNNDGDLLFLDNVQPASVPAWYTDRAAEAERVREYEKNGHKAISKAEAVGVALDRLIRGTVAVADKRVSDFARQVKSASVSSKNSDLFERIAADAERASGSIVNLGKKMQIVGLGKNDPKKTWDIFREINDEVNRQSRRQIFNAGVQYIQAYGHPQQRYPVALIPGFGGTRLQAMMRNSKLSNPCGLDSAAYRDLWLNSKRLFQFLTEARTQNCLYDVLSLLWNGKDFTQRRKYRVQYVKGTLGVDLLDTGVASSLSEYFKPLLVALQTIGYNREGNLRAFGYDWRYRPDRPRMRATFKRWKLNVERMYRDFKKPVVVVAHAMGAQHFIYFLKHYIGADPKLSEAWIEKHIKSFVSIGGNHAGSPRVLKSLISGTSLQLPFFNRKRAGRMLATFGTSAWMLPTAEGFGSTPLLTVVERDGKKRRFSALRMERLLDEAYLKPTVFHYNKIAPMMNEPGKIVKDAHFLYGDGVSTPTAFVYERTYGKNGEPKGLRHLATKKGKGDGMVPLRSSKFLCARWRGSHCQGFSGVNHRELLWHLPLLTQVLEVATGIRDAANGLVHPDANPLDHIDADGSKAETPGFDNPPDLGAPSDVDGQEVVIDRAPGETRSADETRKSVQPLFGGKE